MQSYAHNWYRLELDELGFILVGSEMSCWSPYTSAILISLSVLLSLQVEIISQLRSPMTKYSTFSLSLRILIEVSGGLYHVTTFSTSPAQSSLEPGVLALSSDT